MKESRTKAARENGMEDPDSSRVYAMVVGKLLKALRLEARLTQQELASRAAITRSTLSRIERGQKQPDAPSLRRLAEALRVEPEELTERAEDAMRRAEAATRATLGDGGTGGWQRALKVLGAIGVGGLVAFAVASVLGQRRKH